MYKLELKRVSVEERDDLAYDDILESTMTGKKADVRFMDDSDVEYGEEEYGSSEGEDEQFFTDVNHKALMQLQEQKMSEEMAIVINWDNLVTELENCPKIPQPPVVEQINPPSQPMRREKFGKLMPDDDDKKKRDADGDEIFKGKLKGHSPNASKPCAAWNAHGENAEHKKKHVTADGRCKFCDKCNHWVTDKGPYGRCMGAHRAPVCDNPNKCDQPVRA